MPGKKVNENLDRLEALLERRQELSIREIMEELEISESTARRLATLLPQRGGAARTYGGLCAVSASPTEYQYEALEKQSPGAKRSIARRALSLIASGDVLYLDGGTTVACLAQALREKCLEGTLSQLQVYTNSLMILNLLSGVCTIHCIGGTYRAQRRDFCGELAEKTVSVLRFSLSFLGTDACQGERGFTTTDYETARLAGLVLDRSGRTYVLAGAEKFIRTSLVPYAPLNAATGIITDREPSREIINTLGTQGAVLLIAPPD